MPESFENGPLAGIRILDMTGSWAGPMAGRMLAALGADVVHVEAPERMDGWRGDPNGGHVSLYPGGEPGEHPYNRSSMFNSQNLGKRSLVVNAKDPGGLAALRRLAATCDVLLTNLRCGALDRLGLGYDDLSAIKPDIIVVEMPAFGRTGPLRRDGALGPTMELVAGMAALVGYGDGEPIATGPAYLDPVGAYNATAATLTALWVRAETVMGQHVEVPQSEAGMSWIGEQFLYADAAGETPIPEGNHVPWAAPHNCYPCAGDDEWVAIAACSDAEWVALCQVWGHAEFIDDSRYATMIERLRHQDELDELLAQWTATQDKFQLSAALQEAGATAAPVLNGKDLTRSDYLHERGFFLRLTHPEAGTHEYQGLPFHLSAMPTTPTQASPCFGEHTRAVLTELAGLSTAEVDDLVARGVVVDRDAEHVISPSRRAG